MTPLGGLLEGEIMKRTKFVTRGRIVAAGLLVVATAGLGASAPAVATPESDDLDLVAVVGQDNALWVNDGSGWESLGGQLIDTPSIAIGTRDVYYVGLGFDRNVWIRTDHLGWTRFGPANTRCDGPSAVALPGFGLEFNEYRTPPGLKVTCRGGDGAVWSAGVGEPRIWAVPTTSGWQFIGGGVKYGVSVSDVSAHGTHAVAYTAVGNDDAVWINEGSGAWPTLEGTWYREGGQCTGPAAASEFLEYVGCRGRDGSLWLQGESWFPFGGKIQGKPAITVHSDDSLHAYVLGGDGGVWTRSDSGPWTPYSGVGRYGVAVATFYG
jgi:hypothetical protein